MADDPFPFQTARATVKGRGDDPAIDSLVVKCAEFVKRDVESRRVLLANSLNDNEPPVARVQLPTNPTEEDCSKYRTETMWVVRNLTNVPARLVRV